MSIINGNASRNISAKRTPPWYTWSYKRQIRYCFVVNRNNPRRRYRYRDKIPRDAPRMLYTRLPHLRGVSSDGQLVPERCLLRRVRSVTRFYVALRESENQRRGKRYLMPMKEGRRKDREKIRDQAEGKGEGEGEEDLSMEIGLRRSRRNFWLSCEGFVRVICRATTSGNV